MSFKEKFNNLLNKLGGEEDEKSKSSNNCPKCGAKLNGKICENCNAKQENKSSFKTKFKNFTDKVFVPTEEIKESFKEDKDWQNSK